MKTLGILIAALSVVGCAAETAPMGSEDELSKEEARARGGKTDFGLDFCEIFNWYGDSICDDFCPYFDPDCASMDETCGGLAGLTCDPGEYCDYDEGGAACGAADGTGVCREIPLGNACPAIYAPVCGCDGVTYSNECAATSAGTDVASEGECAPEPGCMTDLDCPQVSCLPGGPCPWFVCNDAGMCVQEEEPACRTDADCPQVSCLPGGPCPFSVCEGGMCVQQGPVACGSRGLPTCGADEYCNYPPEASCGRADVPGVCTPVPEGLACAAVYDPVCGCDGRTYGNACAANNAGMSIDYVGECANDCTTNPCGVGSECQYCFGTFQCVPEGAMC